VYNIDLLAKTEDELSEAFDWYENKLTGLGDAFYKKVNQLLTSIETNPYHYPVKYQGEIRAAILDKFPYLVIYWIDEVNAIIIVYLSFTPVADHNTSKFEIENSKFDIIFTPCLTKSAI
jgi:toxin ParE1/3/4